jgi:hypothetical protein
LRKNLRLAWRVLLFIFGVVGVRAGIWNFSHSVSNIPSPFPQRFREFIDACTPIDPLGKISKLPSIELAIPSTLKDLHYLELAIKSVLKYSANPISCIKVVVPSGQIDEFSKVLGKSFDDIDIQIVDEEKLLGNLLTICNSISTPDRRGWLIQQVVKYLCVLTSDSKGVLIVDSDTILCSPRTWIDENGLQILMISREYHLPYQKHYLAFREKISAHLDVERNPRVSYVTHHQLMQPEHLREMLGGSSSWLLGLEIWINSIDFSSQSPACEYHCYGTFMELHKRDQFTFARWGNVPVNRSEFVHFIEKLNQRKPRIIYKDTCSVSVHAYLQ